MYPHIKAMTLPHYPYGSSSWDRDHIDNNPRFNKKI